MLEARRRLWNPPNPNFSSELDIVSESEARRRMFIEHKQRTARQTAALTQWRIADSVIQAAKKRRMEIETNGAPSAETIIAVVAQWADLTIDELMSRDRHTEVVKPRHIAIYFCHRYGRMKITDVARHFDLDHSTCVKLTQAVVARLKGRNQWTLSAVDELCHRLKVSA